MNLGASKHMCLISKLYIKLFVLKVPMNINLPNSHSTIITNIESVQLFSDMTIHNAL